MKPHVLKRHTKNHSNQRGATVVEFALIAVLLFSLLFAIIEFGILMFDKHILTNASREGARAGIVMNIPRISDAAIEAVVNDYAQENMVSFGPSSTVSTTITPDQTTRETAPFGTELVVSTTYPFEFLLLSNLGLDPITLKAETRMRME